MFLAHHILGRGQEPVIVLHDWFCDSTSYDILHPFLDTSAYQFCFPDLRGYGRSKSLQGMCTVDEAANDIFALANHLGYDRFHLIGHSMSGMIAQYMNVINQERIRSIIAITPVPACGSPVPEDVLTFLEDGARQNNETARQMIHFMSGMRHNDLFANYKVRLWRQCSHEEARIAYLHMFSQTDFSSKMKGLQTPYCIVVGAHDAEAYQENTLKSTLGQWLPQAKWIKLNCGHYPMIETPVDLADVIHKFLESQHSDTSQY